MRREGSVLVAILLAGGLVRLAYLRDLQADFYVCVVDFDNYGIYNQPVSKAGKYYYEMRFPSTLYKWILQVVPRNYGEIEKDLTNLRRTNLFFIIVSMFLTFLSLAVISLAAPGAGTQEAQGGLHQQREP